MVSCDLCFVFCFLMRRRPPRSTRTDTLFPYTTLFRSEVINNDPDVKSIFINIFGGITKGDEVANGIITAMGRVDIGVPIVIRLDGTNADEGRSILEPHLSEKLQMASTMVEAAETAVALAAK